MIQKLRMIFSWIKFRLRSVNAHGLHSPFLFDLYNKMTDGATYYMFGPLASLRSKMLTDTRKIEVFDAGAGSHLHGKKEKRKVSDIAGSSLKKQKRAEFLFKIVNEFQCKYILELGTSLGITSCYLAAVSHESKVITIEAAPEIAKIARENISLLDLKNIDVVDGKFDDVLDAVLANQDTLDLVFIDGDHRYEAVLKNFNKILPKLNNNSVVILDDIHWSTGMEQAWKEIMKDEKVRVSIDVYDMGILFFRKEMSKEDFSIRF